MPGTVLGSWPHRRTSAFSSSLHLSGGNRHKLISEQIPGEDVSRGVALTKQAHSWNWGWESLALRPRAIRGMGATLDNMGILSEEKKQRIDANETVSIWGRVEGIIHS